jgi:hypothetical protein
MQEPKFKMNQLVKFTEEFRMHDKIRGSLGVIRFGDVTGKIHSIYYDPADGTSGGPYYKYSIEVTGSTVSVSKDEAYLSAIDEEINHLKKTVNFHLFS